LCLPAEIQKIQFNFTRQTAKGVTTPSGVGGAFAGCRCKNCDGAKIASAEGGCASGAAFAILDIFLGDLCRQTT